MEVIQVNNVRIYIKYIKNYLSIFIKINKIKILKIKH